MTQSRADCVIWLKPYNGMREADNGEFPFPTMTIIDVVLSSRKERLIYDALRMVSSEE